MGFIVAALETQTFLRSKTKETGHALDARPTFLPPFLSFSSDLALEKRSFTTIKKLSLFNNED